MSVHAFCFFSAAGPPHLALGLVSIGPFNSLHFGELLNCLVLLSALQERENVAQDPMVMHPLMPAPPQKS